MIGVVGGIGPYAGLEVVRSIYNQTVAGKDQDHLPVALLSLPSKIKDRTAYLLGEIDENPGYAIAEALLKLERMGATVAGIACNTAHAPDIFNVIVSELKHAGSGLRVVHIIEEVVGFLKSIRPGGGKIGVLSTNGTYRFKLYENALTAAGFEFVPLPEALQDEKVHNSIYHPVYGIKARANPISPQAKKRLREAITYLSEHGAEAIILGCSELPLAITSSLRNEALLIDPNAVLALALIRALDPAKAITSTLD